MGNVAAYTAHRTTMSNLAAYKPLGQRVIIYTYMPEAILGSQGLTILNRLTIAKMLRPVTSINRCLGIKLFVLLYILFSYKPLR